MPGKTSVVVVGGGVAGAGVIRALSKKLDKSKHDLILINSRPFDTWLPGLVRAVVTGENNLDVIDKGVFTSYDHMLGIATLKVGTVASIESSNDGGIVHLEDGSTVPYSVLILASGSVWEGPLSLPANKSEIDDHLTSWRKKFANSKHVVIAGGGAVGAELAGELKDLYPEKPVTIVQGPDMILNSTYKPKFRQIVQKGLTDRKINVVYGDYIDNLKADGTPASAEVTTRNGKILKHADLVVATRGGKPNTSFLASSGFEVTSTGHVPVEQTLQVKGHSRVFALGDITDIKEQKQAAKYGAHVGVVTANVLSVLNNKEASSKYGGSPEIILLTNGKNGGAGFMGVAWGITLGAWFARMMKSKDMMIGMHRKEMGLTA